MYQVFAEFYSHVLFEGSKNQCRKFLQAKVSERGGRLRKIITDNWADKRNVTCWCSETDVTYEVRKVN